MSKDAGTVLAGGNRRNGHKERQPGITPTDFWEKNFSSQPYNNDIEKILEMPGIEDFAGIFSRANFRSERQRIAALRLVYKLKRYGLESRLELVRNIIASTIGISALGKMLQLQASTDLVMPDVNREILGMKKVKSESVQRSSDYREDTREDRQ